MMNHENVVITEDSVKVIFDDAGGMDMEQAMLTGEVMAAVQAHAEAAESGDPIVELEAAAVLRDLIGRLTKPVRNVILQNRDRSTPAMIAQMTQIASAPDYFRVAPTREFASGTPIVFGEVLPASIALGRKDKAVAADGTRFAVQYAVVEADDLLTSNKADGTAIEAYTNGVPGKLRAIAGNGRLAGLKAGLERGTAADYVRELAEDDMHGVKADDIAKFAQPILVRIMNQDDVTENIGDISNQRGTSDLSPVEQAQNDSKRLDLSALDIADDGSPTEAAALAFIAAMPESERNNLMDGKNASKKAYDRLMASVFWKAYGDAELVRLYAQSVDPEVKTILGGMASASGDLAKLDGAGEMDIRSVITEAATLAINAKRQGVKLGQFAKQVDMTISPETMVVVGMFAENIRSAKKIGERLRAVARFAYEEFTKEDTDMFGAVEKASREQVLERVNAPAADDTVSMFDSIDPLLELQLTGDLLAKTEALKAASEDDPLVVVTISSEILAIIKQLTDADMPEENAAAPAPELSAEEKAKLAEKRAVLQDFISAKPDSANVDSWRAEIERINGIIGASVEDGKQSSQKQRIVAKSGDPDYMQAIYDLRYEWETGGSWGDAKKVGAFKTRLRALAKKVPMSDEKAVFYIDSLITLIFGADYDPKVADVTFAPAAMAAAALPQPDAGAWKNLRSDILSSMGAIAGIDQGTSPGFDRSLFVSSIAGKIRRAHDRGDTALAGTALAFVAENQKLPQFKKPVFAPANKLWKDVDWQPYAAQFVKAAPADEAAAPAAEVPTNGRKEFVDAMTFLKPFISKPQFQAIKVAATGEEAQFYYDKMVEMANVVKTMPHSYQTDGKGLNAVVHLHYFRGSSDWFITEKDREGKGTEQAFGYTILNNDRQNAEMGYVSIEELVGRNVELDLYWDQKTLAQVKARKSDDDEEGDAPAGPQTNMETGVAILKDAAETFGGKLSGFTQSGTNWQYADLVINGETLRMGVSTGGVVSVNGDPFTPDRKTMNVTLEALLISIKSRLPEPGEVDDWAFDAPWEKPAAEIAAMPQDEFDTIVAKLTDQNYHTEALSMQNARAAAATPVAENQPAPAPELASELAPVENKSKAEGMDMEFYVKIAADSIGQLRRVDVYRVLNAISPDNIDGVTRSDLATYIVANRPDLADEVASVMAEEWPDLGWAAPGAAAAPAAGTGADADAAPNPDRAADLDFLKDVAGEKVDMMDDDLGDKLEAVVGKYEGDDEMLAAWKEAVTAYTNYMVKSMSQ